MITIEHKAHFDQGRRGKKELRHGERTNPNSSGRVPRISRLMALAIRFDQMLRGGLVSDQAELARLGHVSRARLTQIMNLLSLAPDIQEEILFLRPKSHGHGALTERHLRPIAAQASWNNQREIWDALAAKPG